MTLLGWLSAATIGVSLGMLGSGGSILTVPALVFFVHLPDKAAITASLAIVGAIATVGSVPAAARRTVDWRTVSLFSVAGLPGTALGSWIAEFVTGPIQLSTFAVVLLLAATFTMRSRSADTPGPPTCRHCALLIAGQGTAVGVLTGFVGVGGGFLIVPAFIIFGGLSMRHAVGSSLVVVAVNSWIGFAAHVFSNRSAIPPIDWDVIFAFVAVGAAGSLAGQFGAARLPQAQLKRLFAVVLVVVAMVVLWHSMPRLL